MEDANLDDFFAKKDKSKKKSKLKSGEGDDSLKSLTKKDKKKDKDKTSSSNSSSGKTQERKRADDDEWNDFEEEKAVDYSGLRIQTLQQKEEQEKDGDGEEEELDEFGEVKERKDGASGPWNKSGGAAASATPTSAAVEEEKPAPPTPASTGKYIPPSQRAAALNPASSVPKTRRKKEMPNLKSDLDFPTLAGQGPQPASHVAMRDTHSQRKAGASLSLENKFSVLQD